jgi:uncharacterized membrane protein YphA (DoxX/SURF4 family)
MKNIPQTELKRVILTLLRISIGWHFFYEGVVKLFAEKWSAYSFLANTSGFLSGFYHWISASPQLMKVVDLMNVYGLIIIGLGLFIGFLVRYAAISGALLLTLYYFAYPPFGASLLSSGEGHLFIVDKLFIETLALLFLVFTSEVGYGIDMLLSGKVNLKKSTPVHEKTSDEATVKGRREALKNLFTIPALGLMGWGAFTNSKKYDVDVMTGATIQVKSTALAELKGELPKGKIGKHQISRLVAGGNLIGGWAHSRDLIYVSSLFKAYNTEKKVYETLILAENAGIDTINIGFVSNPLMAKYKKATGSKIKVISQVAPNMKTGDIFEQINGAIDNGADILQIQGNWCDWLVRDRKTEVIEKMMSRIREHGITVGLAAHSVESLIRCEERGIIPDYYMKTMHHDNYWSAHPRENRIPFEVDGKTNLDHNKWHDNCFCLFPEKTVEFVSKAKVPVMGFKVLAAGAIEPEDGFRWAFENGADFICVGMFDFQLVNNVNIAMDILKNMPNRKREWFG